MNWNYTNLPQSYPTPLTAPKDDRGYFIQPLFFPYNNLEDSY